MRSGRLWGAKLSNFWDGKIPCWDFFNCSRYVYPRCPAYLNPESPCWECAYTQNEILLGIRKDCKSCKILKLYSGSNANLSSEIPLMKDGT